MKKIKDTWWNRTFHAKELSAYKAKKRTWTAMIGWKRQLDQNLEKANSLQGLINVHRFAWTIGYQNLNLGPCPWGMFRCDNILDLDLGSLYLGDIYGLWTFKGSDWEASKGKQMGPNSYNIPEETLVYDLIVRQYRRHLQANFNHLVQEAAENLK